MFKSSRLARLTLLQFALLILFPGLSNVGATAQSLPDERIIENKIPSHLPLKIKMKNLSKVKDLKNGKWLRDLELEVTNTGDKPIYHFLILVDMPEVISPSGVPFGYTLGYGRPQLHDPTLKAIPEDVPLNPGESCILKVPEQDWRGWAAAKAKGEAFDPIKVILIFTGLNFGDGTGLRSIDGHPHPGKVSSCGPQRRNGDVSTNAPGISNHLSLQLSSSSLPVNF